MIIGPRPPDAVVVLDTDVLNDWRFRKSATLKAIEEYIAAIKAPPALTATTVFEAIHGFEKAIVKVGTINEKIKQGKERVQDLIRECDVLAFNQEAAEIAAYIYPRLPKSERQQHGADIFIASTALAHEHGVATRNQSDYELIARHAPSQYPPLRIEIWKA
jgi:predicted nucleic acid-binding protein